MLSLQTERGTITIDRNVFHCIVGAVATSCFGVKGMAYRSRTDGLIHLLRRESMAKGVRAIEEENGSLSIQLHIVVDAGVNLPAIANAIISEVRYNLQRLTGIQVNRVEVFVDSVV